MSGYPWTGHKILVVDDSKNVIEELKQRFRETRLEVTAVAHDGLEALEKLKEEDFDLISLDVIMPEMHGIECFKKIKENYPEQKIFFVSNLANDPRSFETMEDKIPETIILGKPLEKDKLIEVLAGLYDYSLEDEMTGPGEIPVDQP